MPCDDGQHNTICIVMIFNPRGLEVQILYNQSFLTIFTRINPMSILFDRFWTHKLSIKIIFELLKKGHIIRHCPPTG